MYMEQHREHWGAPVTLIAEQDYSDGKYKFLQPPTIEGGTIPNGNYRDTLLWTLEQIKNKFVVIMMADYLIYEDVDKNTINKMCQYMRTDSNILRIELGNARGIEQVADHTDTFKGIKILEHNFLPSALTPGIWNREGLIDMAKHTGPTAWDMELDGRDWFAKSGKRSLGSDHTPIIYENALRARDNVNLVLNEKLQKFKR